MNEDANVQDKPLEGQPNSELHTETKPAEEGGLPPDTKERTKEQFEKLTKANQELSDKLKAFEEKTATQSVFDSLRPTAAPSPINFNATPGIIPANVPELVDESGYVNADVLKNSIESARQRAEKAERDASELKRRFVNFEETQQIKMAHEKHPELDPHSNKFDETFYKLVRNELIGQMMNGEKDVLKAADSVRKFYQPKVVVETPKPDEADQKQQINAGKQHSGQVDTYKEIEDSQLAAATRRGDKKALAERLRRAGL